MKVAIVGGGISGLCCAYWLSPTHEVTLFEAEAWIGGHTNTIEIVVDDKVYDVDTGFIVFNEVNYPRFSNLLRELSVPTQDSEMSFSVSSGSRDFEYRGNGMDLWVQPTNCLRPSFMRLLVDIVRFNSDARALLAAGDTALDDMTVADLLSGAQFSTLFETHYLLPLGTSIWSADPTAFGSIPASMFLRFLNNHGMLQLKGRPQWRTVVGGSHEYVRALTRRMTARVHSGNPIEKVVRSSESVSLLTRDGPMEFDAVVLALHSDQALRLLSDPSPAERQILGSIRYLDNVATLHTDTSMLPKRKRAWASWNAYLPTVPYPKPTVTYWMNCLQRLDAPNEFCVSLNRSAEIESSSVIGEWTYSHPIYDLAAVSAQRRRSEIQGARRTYYCGAYWGYGFHEDGVRSAAEVCNLLGVRTS
jgi:uncharacterized protein